MGGSLRSWSGAEPPLSAARPAGRIARNAPLPARTAPHGQDLAANVDPGARVVPARRRDRVDRCAQPGRRASGQRGAQSARPALRSAAAACHGGGLWKLAGATGRHARDLSAARRGARGGRWGLRLEPFALHERRPPPQSDQVRVGLRCGHRVLARIPRGCLRADARRTARRGLLADVRSARRLGRHGVSRGKPPPSRRGRRSGRTGRLRATSGSTPASA